MYHRLTLEYATAAMMCAAAAFSKPAEVELSGSTQASLGIPQGNVNNGQFVA